MSDLKLSYLILHLCRSKRMKNLTMILGVFMHKHPLTKKIDYVKLDFVFLHLHFFFLTQKTWDRDENLFNPVKVKNFKWDWKFSFWEIKFLNYWYNHCKYNSLSKNFDKESLETISWFNVNIRSFSKNFYNLLDIL